MGHQPMPSADGSLWLTFNGEIYNYIELREILESLGRVFKTKTDTEVALQAYQQWGTDCFSRFNGMWAIGIYDRDQKTMLLSRDRFGKKPLYYHTGAGALVFASEPKAVFQYPGIERKPNLRKIYNYAGRHYRYVDSDKESFFEGLEQVPPSSWMIFRSDGSRECRIYWTLNKEPLLTENHSERDLVEMLRLLLTDAVKIRLRSDVPVGAMLSGGMDSTSITCLAAQLNPAMKSFSSVTGDGYYDETEYIKEVVERSGVKSEFIYPQAASLFETLTEMLNFHDEPVCTASWLSIYQIVREISKFQAPVVLTGHGGDELFAGYWDHYHYNFADIRAAGGDDSEERARWLENHKRDPAEYGREKDYTARLQADRQTEVQKYSKYTNYLSPELQARADSPAFGSPFSGELSRRLYLELLHETVPASLRAEDRNCMAFSIENRVPLLDYRLAEFAFRLPNNYKIRDGLGKWILREAMRGILPEKVRTRKDKTGHNLPFDQWIRGVNKPELERMMDDSGSFANKHFYNVPKVKELFNAHLAGENHYMFFWQYINLSLWAEKHFGR
jgi:asparagine synthase (glutamine-hydrolysing)